MAKLKMDAYPANEVDALIDELKTCRTAAEVRRCIKEWEVAVHPYYTKQVAKGWLKPTK